jgi:hypothetical protein
VIGWWRYVVVMLAGVAAIAASGCAPAASTEAFCTQVTALTGLDQALTGDPSGLAEASRSLSSLAGVAPDEVRPAVELLSVALDTMSRAAAGIGAEESDPTAQLEAAVRALAPDIAVVEQASATVESYTSSTCGIDLGSATTAV